MSTDGPPGGHNPFAPPAGDPAAAPVGAPVAGPAPGPVPGPPPGPWSAGPVPPPPSGYEARPVPPAPAHGAAPYGPPAYGAPAYGAPPAPGGYPPPGLGVPGPGGWPGAPGRPAGSDPLAVASLVTSLAGLLTAGLSALVGIGLGIAALVRTSRSGRPGRGLAVAGVVVGVLVVAGWVLAGLAVAVFASGSSAEAVTSEGPVDATDGLLDDAPLDDGSVDEDVLPDYTLRGDLAAGDCLAGLSEWYDLRDVDVADCALVHDAEVLAALPMDGPVELSFDVYDAEYEALVEACDALASDLGLARAVDADLGWNEVYYPHPADWDGGARTSYCVFTSVGTDLTGSAVAGDLVGPVGSTT
ncbi:DUF4190 domain-containing protein [Cellulomonas endophytica]|uniref:DUF4190 domain-containing protein n=1 Tax=Cellulomonas endophytica TaxID=2494735 RepID=UPI001012F9C2|nr:DUF4190 domain-containing protein [Cellulomonas endophytica]